MSTCPDIAEWEAFAHGASEARRSDELAAHIDNCPACCKLLLQVRENNEWLGAMRSVWAESFSVPDESHVPVGKRIGRYEVTGLLGSGGMATVYSAQQENPRRTVALKVLRPGFASPAALRRLEHEAELLGRLQHPGIARIYEAGYAELAGTRQPFFAMERVEGPRLIEFADRRKLGTRGRLELMARIGEAVHFAHQKGVIHRDLKPGNILVVDEGTAAESCGHKATKGHMGTISAQPKILDFGVARCTDADLQTTTLHTDVGQLVGTIPYMSPEQAAGDPAEIDLRSDVYALGVVTYELLTGRLPYEVRDKGVAAAVQIIREEEPAPLSQTNKLLRGDIQTIVAKALEKDKRRRYGSAADFVADIRRLLNDEPISARPPSATYQLAKFAKRNKALVTGVAAVFVALLAGLMGTGWGMLRATAERNRAVEAMRVAETRRAEAETVTGLLTEMLGSANPNQVKGADYTVRKLLDDFAEGLDGRFPGQPEVEATIRAAIGNAYRGLGLRPEGEVQLKAALELRRRTLAPDHPDVARSLYDYGWWQYDNAELGAAERTFREALQVQRKAGGADDVRLADTLNSLAEILRFQGKHEEAEPLVREGLAVRNRVLGPNHPDFAGSLHTLGRILRGTKRYDEAEGTFRESLAVYRAAHGDRHPAVSLVLRDLAHTLVAEGDTAAADAAFRESLATGREAQGDEHHDVGITAGDYGGFLSDTEKYAAAETQLNNAVAILRRVHGDMHICLTSSLTRLCVLLTRMEEYARAEPVCRETLTICTAVEKEPQWMAQFARRNLAQALIGLGKTEEAVELSQQALAFLLEQKSNKNDLIANVKRIAGLALLRNGDAIAAEPLLRESIQTYQDLPDSEPWRVATAKGDLGECLLAQGRFEEAEQLLLEGYTLLQEDKGVVFAETRANLRRLIALYEHGGRPQDARLYRDLLATAQSSRQAQNPLARP